MSLSSFSLILGVFFYVTGFPLVFSDKRYAAWRRKVMKDSTILRFLGLILAMIAVTTLRSHSQITPDIPGLVVMFAWILFIKSLSMVWWPEAYERYQRSMQKRLSPTPVMQVVLGFLMVLAGAFFTYAGILLPS